MVMENVSGRDPTGQALVNGAASVSALTGFDPSRIPDGSYCYARIGPMDEGGIMRIKGMCPYWERREGDNAYCRFLGYATETPRELLWDQVKICDVRDDD
jgi:hypothetical protein